jgi:hypothetical protein
VWRIKFRDVDGRQINETLGKGPRTVGRGGRGEAALRARLVAVERDGLAEADGQTFEAFAREWLDTFPEAKQHRRTARADYRGLVENHLIPWFGSKRLAEIRTADFDAYVAAKRRAGPPLGPRRSACT